MIQFHPPAAANNRAFLDYAVPMAQALSAIGYPARTGPTLGDGPGDIRVLDQSVLDTLPIAACAGAVLLMPSPNPERPADPARSSRMAALRGVICAGQAMADQIRSEYGLTATVVVPGSAPRPITVPGPGPVRILSAGTRTAAENSAWLQALSRLLDLDWSVTRIGPGPDDAIPPALTGRITVETTPDPATHDALFARVGLVVLPSDRPDYAVVAEAYRRGIPVVTTAAGLADLPAGALVVDAADGATLSKVLRRVLFDAGLRHDLAHAAAGAGATLPDWPTQAALFAAAVT